MNTLVPLLVWRYIRDTRNERSIATMIKLCFVSMFIGSCALALVMAIMNGFEKVTHEKMQGIHAQIIMQLPEDADAYTHASTTISTQIPTISAYAPQDHRQIVANNAALDHFETITLKAIDPVREPLVSTLESKITTVWNTTTTQQQHTEGQHTLAHALTGNHILIGKKLAETLALNTGDTINILFPSQGVVTSATIHLGGATAVIGGIFSTGIEEFDAGMALCSFETLHTFFPDATPSQLALKLAPGANEANTIATLKAAFPDYTIYAWKELYPALVSALVLEKYAMFFILALIMLVACMNIVSVLFMQITHKRGDIAIMKAMGMADSAITRLFVWLGMSISLTATLLGLAFASGISWFLETYPFITLPDVYFVTYLPARMEWTLLAQVLCVIVCISFLATWIPAHKTRSIRIADVLRFEA